MNREEAFDVLLGELDAALRAAESAGERAWKEKRYGDAEAAGRRAAEIDAQVRILESLRAGWPEAPVPARFQPGRASSGDQDKCTSREFYFLPILHAIERLGGSAKAGQVIDVVESVVPLTVADRGHTKDGTLRWKKIASWARHVLVSQGLLAGDSPHGVWEITDAGREYVRAHGG